MLPLHSEQSSDRQIDSATTLREDLDPGTATAGVTTYLAGQPTIWAGMQELSKEDLAKAEAGGFPIVAIILLVVFGSLAAAALPLVLGFVSVIVTGALIYFISLQMETSVFVTNMASMIGIGVAIDYSLFILARYREERATGRDQEAARAEALSTSGLAVAFSGLAVIVSLAGLWMVDNQALRSMALGAMTVVAVSILTAMTLLPALIAMLGDRVLPGGIVAKVLGVFRRRGERPDREAFWVRWTTRVMAHPVARRDRRLRGPAHPGDPAALDRDRHPGARSSSPRTATCGSATNSPPSSSAAAPTRCRSSPPSTARAARPRRGGRLRPHDRGDPGRQLRRAARLRRRRRPDPGDAERPQRVRRDDRPGLRGCATASCRPPQLSRVATVDVGGETARSQDARAQISGSMWKIVLFVLALSYLVLMVMLRSLLLPLKAVLMNLLSIGAAFGVLVAIFQWGWFASLLGFESQGALDTINVPLIFAIVFGLSMDYEVFLMSRIREHYLEHGDNERAVAEGLSTSARTISSAALIMTAVFAVFVLTGVPSIKELGLGCAVAIALDATLVRLILVPAAMKLLGDWNWWMPSWLDRALPDLSFESGAPEPEPAEA